MHIQILGAESLGVRGLSCVVEVKGKIVIDPGLALGYQRYRLPPHPAQVAVGGTGAPENHNSTGGPSRDGR